MRFGNKLWVVCLSVMMGLSVTACGDDDDDDDDMTDARPDARDGSDGNRPDGDGGPPGDADGGPPGDADATPPDADAEPPPTADQCAEECTEDGDCTIGGMDMGYTCEDNRCFKEPPPGCEADAECVAQAQGWFKADSNGDFLPDAPCTADGPTPPDTCPMGEVCCAATQICVVGGYCATAPSMFVMCSTLMGVDVMTMKVDGTTAITVCGKGENAEDATCNTDTGVCRNPCNADSDCLDPRHPTCNDTSGDCDCSGTSCEMGTTGGDVCLDSGDLSGKCGCENDDDCRGTGLNKCTDGVCGCADATVCPDMTVFGGTEYVCE